MKAYLVTSKANHGSSFRLVKHAVDEASSGKKVLFVTIEMDVAHTTERIHGYVIGTQINSENLNITVRQAKALDFMEPDEKFDVVVVDSPYLLFREEPTPILPYEKLFGVVGDALLIMNTQVKRNAFENGYLQVYSFDKFPKWVVSATYIENVESLYVETTIDVLTGAKTDVATVYVIKKAPMMKISYLTKAV
jgi:hypothetical protein